MNGHGRFEAREACAERCCHLEGFLTEDDLRLAEEEFPGISGFYREQTKAAAGCPRTFLELLGKFGAFAASAHS